MASKARFSKHRNQWVMKYKPDPTGPWIEIPLGKHDRPVDPEKPPKRPPMEIQDRRQEFVEIEYRAKHNLSPAPSRIKSLEVYLSDYVARYETLRKAGSVKQLKRAVERFKKFCNGEGIKSVQGVAMVTCRDYLEMRGKEIIPTTLQTEKGFLSPIWTRAVEDGLVAINPWMLAKIKAKKIKVVPTFWKSAEIAAIVAKLTKPWQADLVLVLANTGIRISATLAMRWDWIDWGAGKITIPVEHDKGGYGYVHDMGQGARSVLERRHILSKSDLVFPHWKTGGVIAYDTANDAIAKAIVRAEVSPGTPHDFRHTYARSLERAGVPMSIIQAQLGHRSSSMTEHYTTATAGEAAKWVGGFDVTAPPVAPGI